MIIRTQIGRGQVLQEDRDPDAFRLADIGHLGYHYQEGALAGYQEVVSQSLPGRRPDMATQTVAGTRLER